MYLRLLVFFAALGLVACSDETQHTKELVAARDAEVALLRNALQAGPEIDRRLRERLHSDGLLLTIKEEYGEMHAIPSTAGWSINCGTGVGLSIAAAGQAEGLHIEISDVLLGERDCSSLLPLTAAKVTAILAGK